MVLCKCVAKNPKATRLERGLSQQDLANKTGLTVRYISRLENTAPNVTLGVIEKRTTGLNCSTTDVMGTENDQLLPGTKEMLDKNYSISSEPAQPTSLKMIKNLARIFHKICVI